MVSRCWAPSWRLRSRQRRSSSAACTIRRREALSWSSFATDRGGDGRAPSLSGSSARTTREARVEQARAVEDRAILRLSYSIGVTTAPWTGPSRAGTPSTSRYRRRSQSHQYTRSAGSSKSTAAQPGPRPAMRGSGSRGRSARSCAASFALRSRIGCTALRRAHARPRCVPDRSPTPTQVRYPTSQSDTCRLR